MSARHAGNSKQVTPKQRTNKTPNSLVKVKVVTDKGKWLSPNVGATFAIAADTGFPAIRFEIDTAEPGPYQWRWSMTWDAHASGLKESKKRGKKIKSFSESGTFSSQEKSWVAAPEKVIGGRLKVEVQAGTESFIRSVEITGTNPSSKDVQEFLKTLPDTAGFEKLLEQETHAKHFINADGLPIVAFDGGCGLTQLTKPAPTFEQTWNWKENLKAGAKLYQAKQKEARSYLSHGGRTFTDEQLRLETWSRWNGGAYHVWDQDRKAWVRNDDMLCDTQTGNIGWDMTADANTGKTASALHERDRESYSNPKKNKTEDNQWKYSGECYADHVNAQ